MSIFNHPMVTHEQWEKFTQADHQTWQTLFKRQSQLLKKCTSHEINLGISELKLCDAQIPKISELNNLLMQKTGFNIVPVKGFIPADLFFQFLSMRLFPSTCFIRKPSQLDYLEEPDIFHDIFGHVPLLMNPIFANFMEQFGHKGLEAIQEDALELASTLYWFTVEFGLLKSPQGLRAYGAGIISSKGELIYSLKSSTPARVHFNLLRLMKTQYHIDSFQKTYFVISSLDVLFQMITELDWKNIKKSCNQFPEIEQGVILHTKEMIGDQR